MPTDVTQKGDKPKKEKVLLPPDYVRNGFVKAKVNSHQKQHIEQAADECGLSVSDYIVYRCYGYEPHSRLSQEEETLLQNLMGMRTDLLKYHSALNAMKMAKRTDLFDNVPTMYKWYQLIVPITNAVIDFVNNVRQRKSDLPDSYHTPKGEDAP